MNQNKKDIITCNVSNTVSSMLSSVTAVAKDFILNLFPEDYFKDVYITTTQTSSEMSSMDPDEIKIKRYPIISINPMYYPDSNEAVMNPFPLWRRGQFERFREEGRYGYKRVFYNDTDEIYISSIPYRIKFGFDVKIKVESHLEKIDLTHVLRQKFNQGERFFLNNNFFEAEIPNTIIKAISAIKDYDLTDPDEYQLFCDYMSQYSNGSIHSKVLHSTGNKMFSYMFMSNLLVNVENPPNSDGRTRSRNNMSDAEGEVEFELSTELWIPGNYMFVCKELPVGDYKPQMNESKLIIDKAVNFIPMQTRGHRSRLRWERFVTEANVSVDRISFRELFTKEIIKFIDDRNKHYDTKLLEQMFEVVIFQDKKELKEGEDYRINWRKQEITMLYPYYNYVYHVGIYVDNGLLFKFVAPKPVEH